jgi:hypothetical protein
MVDRVDGTGAGPVSGGAVIISITNYINGSEIKCFVPVGGNANFIVRKCTTKPWIKRRREM